MLLGPYRAAEGWVALPPYSDANWQDFFSLIDQPELAADPRFSSHGARIENAVELYQYLVDAAPTRTVDEWIAICEQHSIPASPVLDIADLFDDEHLEAVDLMSTVEHPHLGPYRTIRHPVSYDTMSTDLRRHAPIPGEHTMPMYSANLAGATTKSKASDRCEISIDSLAGWGRDGRTH